MAWLGYAYKIRKEVKMQNSDVAHRFFYDENGQFDRRSMSVSYQYNKFYSYATVIGKITKDVNNNTVCIISDNNFSNTTAKHLNALRYACPHKIYYLPQYYGSGDFYPADVIKHLKDNLEYYSKAKLTQKHNREGLTHYYNMLNNTLNLLDFKTHFKEIKTLLKQYKSIYEAVNNPEELKHLKELQAKREKQQKEKLKRQVNKLLKSHSYLDLLKFAYSDFWFNDTSIEAYNTQKEQKQQLKKYFNPKDELSFIWFDSDYAKTSQHITVDKKEAIVLLKLWLNGKLKHGMTISHYTVMEVTSNYVKIGCHKIPVENIKELAKSVNLELKEVA